MSSSASELSAALLHRVVATWFRDILFKETVVQADVLHDSADINRRRKLILDIIVGKCRCEQSCDRGSMSSSSSVRIHVNGSKVEVLGAFAKLDRGFRLKIRLRQFQVVASVIVATHPLQNGAKDFFAAPLETHSSRAGEGRSIARQRRYCNKNNNHDGQRHRCWNSLGGTIPPKVSQRCFSSE